MDEQDSIATRLVRLVAEYPCAGENDRDFSLDLPSKMSERGYDLIVQHIEFRRRCMNQGFDNLLSLLAMHREALTGTDEHPRQEAEASPPKQDRTS